MTIAQRHKMMLNHFPTAMGVDDFMARVEMALAGYGFTGDNSIGTWRFMVNYTAGCSVARCSALSQPRLALRSLRMCSVVSHTTAMQWLGCVMFGSELHAAAAAATSRCVTAYTR
jgi:hypothetical protein